MIASATMRLLWLVSPALPVGAYAYSRGLEYAVHAGWVHDADSARDWVLGVLEHQVGRLDAPVLARIHDAYREGRDVQQWAQFLTAARESAEFALEDRQLGISLAKVLREQYQRPRPASDPHEGLVRDLADYDRAFGLAGSGRTDNTADGQVA